MRAIAINAASIELRETIRKIASATPKTSAAPKPTGQEIASNTHCQWQIAAERCNRVEFLVCTFLADDAANEFEGSQTWQDVDLKRCHTIQR